VKKRFREILPTLRGPIWVKSGDNLGFKSSKHENKAMEIITA